MRWLGIFRRSHYRGRHRQPLPEVPERSYDGSSETVVYDGPEPAAPDVVEVPAQRIEIGFADGSTAVVADPEVVSRLQTAAARLRATID